MGSLDGLHVEIEAAIGRVGTYGGITRICQGTALAITETSDIELVAAEGLTLGGL